MNRTNWLKEAGGKQVTGCQALCNKLPPLAFKIVAKAVWFICTARSSLHCFDDFINNQISLRRNAIVVIVCLIMAMLVDPAGTSCKLDPENCTFTLTGEIDSGLPAFQPPPFSVLEDHDNSTSAHTKHFGEMLSTLGSAVIIIPLIAILESVAIAKAFGNFTLIFT